MTAPAENQIGKRGVKALSRFLKFILVLLVFAASILVLTVPENEVSDSISNPVVLQEADKTIYSKCDFTMENCEWIERARKEAMDKVPFCCRRMNNVSDKLAEKFRVFFEEIGRRAAAEQEGKPYGPPEAGKQVNVEIYPFVRALSEPDFQFFRSVNEKVPRRQEFLRKVSNEILNKGVLAGKIRTALQQESKILIFDEAGGKYREFTPEPLSEIFSEFSAGARAAEFLIPRFSQRSVEAQRQFSQHAAQLFSVFFIGGNLEPDQQMTDKKRDEAKKSIEPRKFKVGDVLIRKGQRLSQDDLNLLRDYDKARRQEKGTKFFSRVNLRKTALCLIFLIFSVFCVAWVHPDLFRDDQKVWLLGGIAVAALLANRIFAGVYPILFEGQYNFTPQLVFLALPLGMAAGLISVVCGLRAAFSAGLFVSGVTAVALNNSFQVAVTGLLVSGVVAVAVRNVSDYKKYFTALFLACTLSTLFTGGVFLMDEIAKNQWEIVRDASVLATATGAATATLALLSLFALETIFDVSTNMTYLACTDRNHPLLKRLQLEAPGTYYHSQWVATIAGKAAGLIGANPLQVQACALFHDIGKLSAPGMFTENAAGGNPHQGLSPRESVEIIRRHVTYGLELAKKNKLKKAIRAAIAQHHGTDFISFFYELAKKNADGGDLPDERDFHYPGPLPDSKETVVLAIADFAEAVSRSQPGLSGEELRKELLKILHSRADHGQLDHAPVTVAELKIVIDSLVSSLTAMNHIRIAYPTFGRTETEVKK